MRSGIEIITEVSPENPSEMSLTDDNDVVQALPPNASNQPLSERILPGAAWRGENLLNIHSLNPVLEMAAIDSVSVTNQVTWPGVFRKRFNDLLCRPFCRGMFGDVEVNQSAAAPTPRIQTRPAFEVWVL